MLKTKTKTNKKYAGKLTKKRKQKRMIIFLSVIITAGTITLANLAITGISKTIEFIKNQVGQGSVIAITIPRNAIAKKYNYNDQVPEEVILSEMKTLAKRFNINPVKWEKILRCEATCTDFNFGRHKCVKGEIDNLAENPKSTALGTGQYLINTWRQTESYKQFKKARTDYKASLWEQALDLSTGQQDKWQECLNITGVRF